MTADELGDDVYLSRVDHGRFYSGPLLRQWLIQSAQQRSLHDPPQLPLFISPRTQRDMQEDADALRIEASDLHPAAAPPRVEAERQEEENRRHARLIAIRDGRPLLKLCLGAGSVSLGLAVLFGLIAKKSLNKGLNDSSANDGFFVFVVGSVVLVGLIFEIGAMIVSERFIEKIEDQQKRIRRLPPRVEAGMLQTERYFFIGVTVALGAGIGFGAHSKQGSVYVTLTGVFAGMGAGLIFGKPLWYMTLCAVLALLPERRRLHVQQEEVAMEAMA